VTGEVPIVGRSLTPLERSSALESSGHRSWTVQSPDHRFFTLRRRNGELPAGWEVGDVDARWKNEHESRPGIGTS
jgi:hypothetical protein